MFYVPDSAFKVEKFADVAKFFGGRFPSVQSISSLYFIQVNFMQSMLEVRRASAWETNTGVSGVGPVSRIPDT